jgi:hypothetical protein
MITANIKAMLGAFLVLAAPPAETVIQPKTIQEDCAEVAALVITQALRVIDVHQYRINRMLLRELGCRKVPEVRKRMCAALVQSVSQIGSQGIPGYGNIRDLMRDMNC